MRLPQSRTRAGARFGVSGLASAAALLGVALAAIPATAQTAAEPVSLPSLVVLSERVANQEPVATVAMPVSALRFEPHVDVQARNFAEGQADVAIRGGTFANTGFRLGALPLYDPQTGHYSAEVPIAPEMLAPPRVVTGAAQSREGWNATAGSIAYTWRPMHAGGHIAGSAGQYSTYRGEVHAGAVTAGGLGAEVNLAHSRSDGSIVNGDHEFSRANLRVQQRWSAGQTDLFAGYQSKFFGWPNLYTPFNSPETENLQSVLLMATHRQEWGGEGSFIEGGIYHRRHKDDYAFNRFAPVGPVHPFQHTTWVTGLGFNGRAVWSDTWATRIRGVVLADEIESTSLVFGPFSTRTYTSVGVLPEWRSVAADGSKTTLVAGASFDHTNRDGSAVAPSVELRRETRRIFLRSWSASYSEATQVADYTALKGNPNAGLFRGNAALGRSRSRNLELGGEFAFGGWTGEAAVFTRRDHDLVDWTFRRGVTARLARAVDIDTVGTEVFARRSFGRYDVILGYAWLQKDADYGGAVVDGSFYALNYPKHRLTAALIARLGRGWEVRFDNEARLQQDNPLRQTGGDEAVISALGVYWQVPSMRRLQLSVQVENLWNTNFEEVPAVPAGNRLVTFGARWAW